METGEFGHRRALGDQGVFDGRRVGPAQRHAADDLLSRGVELQFVFDEAVKLGERGLRAGVETAAARGHHDVLQKHAVVEPAALLHHPVDGENQTDRRVEKQVVAAMLGVHGGLVALGDAQQAVQVPADLAAAVDVGRTPFAGVVGVFLGVLRGL